MKPFAGVRILAFTRYLAAPYGTYQLALHGADALKVESPEGVETRHLLGDRAWRALAKGGELIYSARQGPRPGTPARCGAPRGASGAL